MEGVLLTIEVLTSMRDAKGILTKIVSEPNASNETSLWRDD